MDILTNKSVSYLLWCVLLVSRLEVFVQGSGSMYDPPNRGVMWKYRFPMKKNYSYMNLNCGGIKMDETDIEQKAGMKQKCGVCGDRYTVKRSSRSREHEYGGKYGSGMISRYYPAGIKEMSVKVELLAFEKGFFEFRMCKADNKPVTQSCLNENVLPIKEGYLSGTPLRFYPKAAGDYRLTVAIPPDFSCKRCVVQWRYHTGNSWGTAPDGKQGLGKGPQEEFYNCADIRIGGEIPMSVRRNPFFSAETLKQAKARSVSTPSDRKKKMFIPPLNTIGTSGGSNVLIGSASTHTDASNKGVGPGVVTTKTTTHTSSYSGNKIDGGSNDLNVPKGLIPEIGITNSFSEGSNIGMDKGGTNTVTRVTKTSRTFTGNSGFGGRGMQTGAMDVKIPDLRTQESSPIFIEGSNTGMDTHGTRTIVKTTKTITHTSGGFAQGSGGPVPSIRTSKSGFSGSSKPGMIITETKTTSRSALPDSHGGFTNALSSSPIGRELAGIMGGSHAVLGHSSSSSSSSSSMSGGSVDVPTKPIFIPSTKRSFTHKSSGSGGSASFEPIGTKTISTGFSGSSNGIDQSGDMQISGMTNQIEGFSGSKTGEIGTRTETSSSTFTSGSSSTKGGFRNIPTQPGIIKVTRRESFTSTSGGGGGNANFEPIGTKTIKTGFSGSSGGVDQSNDMHMSGTSNQIDYIGSKAGEIGTETSSSTFTSGSSSTKGGFMNVPAQPGIITVRRRESFTSTSGGSDPSANFEPIGTRTIKTGFSRSSGGVDQSGDMHMSGITNQIDGFSGSKAGKTVTRTETSSFTSSGQVVDPTPMSERVSSSTDLSGHMTEMGGSTSTSGVKEFITMSQGGTNVVQVPTFIQGTITVFEGSRNDGSNNRGTPDSTRQTFTSSTASTGTSAFGTDNVLDNRSKVTEKNNIIDQKESTFINFIPPLDSLRVDPTPVAEVTSGTGSTSSLSSSSSSWSKTQSTMTKENRGLYDETSFENAKLITKKPTIIIPPLDAIQPAGPKEAIVVKMGKPQPKYIPNLNVEPLPSPKIPTPPATNTVTKKVMTTITHFEAPGPKMHKSESSSFVSSQGFESSAVGTPLYINEKSSTNIVEPKKPILEMSAVGKPLNIDAKTATGGAVVETANQRGERRLNEVYENIDGQMHAVDTSSATGSVDVHGKTKSTSDTTNIQSTKMVTDIHGHLVPAGIDIPGHEPVVDFTFDGGASHKTGSTGSSSNDFTTKTVTVHTETKTTHGAIGNVPKDMPAIVQDKPKVQIKPNVIVKSTDGGHSTIETSGTTVYTETQRGTFGNEFIPTSSNTVVDLTAPAGESGTAIHNTGLTVDLSGSSTARSNVGGTIFEGRRDSSSSVDSSASIVGEGRTSSTDGSGRSVNIKGQLNQFNFESIPRSSVLDEGQDFSRGGAGAGSDIQGGGFRVVTDPRTGLPAQLPGPASEGFVSSVRSEGGSSTDTGGTSSSTSSSSGSLTETFRVDRREEGGVASGMSRSGSGSLSKFRVDRRPIDGVSSDMRGSRSGSSSTTEEFRMDRRGEGLRGMSSGSEIRIDGSGAIISGGDSSMFGRSSGGMDGSLGIRADGSAVFMGGPGPGGPGVGGSGSGFMFRGGSGGPPPGGPGMVFTGPGGPIMGPGGPGIDGSGSGFMFRGGLGGPPPGGPGPRTVIVGPGGPMGGPSGMFDGTGGFVGGSGMSFRGGPGMTFSTGGSGPPFPPGSFIIPPGGGPSSPFERFDPRFRGFGPGGPGGFSSITGGGPVSSEGFTSMAGSPSFPIIPAITGSEGSTTGGGAGGDPTVVLTSGSGGIGGDTTFFRGPGFTGDASASGFPLIPGFRRRRSTSDTAQ